MNIRHRLLWLSRRSETFERIGNALYEARQGGAMARAVAILRVASEVVVMVKPDPLMDLTDDLLRWEGSRESLVMSRVDDAWVFQAEQPAGVHLGSPDVPELAAQIRARKGKTYSALFIGPTGCGKTTVARLLAAELAPTGRTVRVPGSILQDRRALPFLRQLVEILRPSSLILDDVNWSGPSNYSEGEVAGTSEHLALLEGLYGLCNIALTIMDDSQYFSRQASGLVRGSLYHSGLRPGRIDLIVPMLSPSKADCKLILRHYGVDQPSDDLIKQAAGLPGAYLAELALRIKTNPEHTAQHLRMIKACAPKLSARTGRYGSDGELHLMWKTLVQVRKDVAQVQVELAKLKGVE